MHKGVSFSSSGNTRHRNHAVIEDQTLGLQSLGLQGLKDGPNIHYNYEIFSKRLTW